MITINQGTLVLGVALAYAIRKNVGLKEILSNDDHMENLKTILKCTNSNLSPVLRDGSCEAWWNNEAIVDKTDVVKIGVDKAKYSTDEIIPKDDTSN